MTTKLTHVEVAIALPIHSTFTYKVPENFFPFVSVGKRVLVPFGKPSTTFGQRSVTGYILGSGQEAEKRKTKRILDILDEIPLFPPSMIPFFRWIADYYIYPLGQVIHDALPKGLNLYDVATIFITEAGEKALSESNLTPLKQEILSWLQEKREGSVKTLCKALGKEIPASLIHDMVRSGWVVQERKSKGGTTGHLIERHVALTGNKETLPSHNLDKLSDSKKQIIHILSSKGEISVKDLKKAVPTASRLIKGLQESGYISIIQKKVYRDPFGDVIPPKSPLSLTQEQKNVVTEIINALEKGFSTYLLAGVTGSGKTEVYMHLAAEVIRRGYEVVVLVPEIALISQMERRFRARFGESVAVLHSGLSHGERYDQWMRILNNEVSIVVGARSAIFAPFEKIGLIIVDEEHDTSYKQENNLLYNARDLAIIRANLSGHIALLGSATPSVQSYYNVKISKSIEVALHKRIDERPLPEITVTDLRKHKDNDGIWRIITPELYKGMQETLSRHEQVLIFLNRRGFANFPVCAACGEPLVCKNCDITLTLHRAANAYKCHYCGFTRSSASGCMICGSSGVKNLGFGTEKIEGMMKTLFPDANICRMDRDTTSKKGEIFKILKCLKNQTIDMLIGTQMVAKGHDFPNITLVGIICADLSLSFPDFRAGERTFQILAQVAGRAGRGDVPGKVVLQTYNPNHFSIETAKEQDFRAFYEKEIGFRNILNYPPYSRLIQFRISGKERRKTQQAAMAIGETAHGLRKSSALFSNALEILGPVEAPLAKIAAQYRWQLLLKGNNSKILHKFVRQMLSENPSLLKERGVNMVVDVDPCSMI